MTDLLTSEAVKEYCRSAGADAVGIASCEDFALAPEGFKPGDVLAQCRSVIVLGAASAPEVLRGTAEYTASRNAMLSAMTDMAKKTAKRIKAAGYETKVISAAGGKWVSGDGRKEQFGYISLKHAAEIAGLGVIGKNYLLINQQYGSLLWLSAVLTDAQLEPDVKDESDICGSCRRCIDACPAKALNSLASFDKKGCSKFFAVEDRKFKIKCFVCRSICPHVSGIQPDMI